MIGRLLNVVCIVLAVSSFWLMYSYWSIGTQLESQLVTCLDGK